MRTLALAAAVAGATVVGATSTASADVAPGEYVSTTLSAASVLLQRDGRVEGDELVLIGRYRIHPTPTGGYVDFFPGHRVIMNNDGHGGYEGPAFLWGIEVGAFTLTPR